eukprot:gene13420-13534_t
MMTSPSDLIDFAYGFSLTEGIVDVASDITAVEIKTENFGLRLSISLRPEKMQTHLARKRALSGRTGCGLCGIEDLNALPQSIHRQVGEFQLVPEVIAKALGELEKNQPLNDLTRAVHAAAFFDAAGNLVAVREDVGRHNALDKLIGALLRAGSAAGDGFVVITSRCSFEMVEKAAIFGARAIVSVSAPTSLAVMRAKAHNMMLVAVARPDSALIFQNRNFIREMNHADERKQTEAQAVAGLADHINKFWDPRMRREILALAAAGAAGFEPLVTKAIPAVKPPKAN